MLHLVPYASVVLCMPASIVLCLPNGHAAYKLGVQNCIDLLIFDNFLIGTCILLIF